MNDNDSERGPVSIAQLHKEKHYRGEGRTVDMFAEIEGNLHYCKLGDLFIVVCADMKHMRSLMKDFNWYCHAQEIGIAKQTFDSIEFESYPCKLKFETIEVFERMGGRGADAVFYDNYTIDRLNMQR